MIWRLDRRGVDNLDHQQNTQQITRKIMHFCNNHTRPEEATRRALFQFDSNLKRQRDINLSFLCIPTAAVWSTGENWELDGGERGDFAKQGRGRLSAVFAPSLIRFAFAGCHSPVTVCKSESSWQNFENSRIRASVYATYASFVARVLHNATSSTRRVDCKMLGALTAAHAHRIKKHEVQCARFVDVKSLSCLVFHYSFAPYKWIIMTYWLRFY
jgi:hypothetical protein